MSTCSSSRSRSQLLVGNSQTDLPHKSESTKSLYQVDQQVKFLHLEAEVESLLQQLQIIKQQRLATSGYKE